jgi:hypothetical protein
VAALEERGIGAYIPPPPPKRCKDGTISRTPPTPCKARMQEKRATAAGKRTYALRKETVEPVFGQMQAGRGLRRFRLRRLAKVRGEWALWCLTHNLLKLVGVLQPPQGTAGAWVRGPVCVVPVGSRVVL